MNPFNQKMKLGSFFLASFLIMSCDRSLEDICGAGTFDMDQEITSAISRLEKEPGGDKARQSLSLMENERLDWESWTLGQIKNSEKYLKIIGSDEAIKQIHNSLSQITNLWVEFHGFSEMGDRNKMILILREILILQKRTKEAACRFLNRNIKN